MDIEQKSEVTIKTLPYLRRYLLGYFFGDRNYEVTYLWDVTADCLLYLCI